MKKITIITGTRAEYGLLKPLIRAISDDSKFTLQLVVTGMHLSEEFGHTYKQIEEDGFKIDKKVADNLKGDSASAITKAIGEATIGFADALEDLKPDLIVLLGDRSEMLAAATAGMIKGVPIAHLHGGETTEGAYDEAIRHAITKMSYLHFTSAEVYRRRVIQLGESPDRVFNVGAIAIDSIMNLKLLTKTEFEESINFKLKKKSVLITFHPVTLEEATAEIQFNELLKALDVLEDTTLIFTKPNSDKDGRIITKMIDNYVAQNLENAIAFISLGQLRYLSALQHISVVLGNSSSGTYEAPIFKKPTVNVGDRQKGRLMPKSVINCHPNKGAIGKALDKSFDAQFVESLRYQKNLYGDGTATKQIMEVLNNMKIKCLKKPFYDL